MAERFIRDLQRLGRLYDRLAGPVSFNSDGSIGMVEIKPGIYVPRSPARPEKLEKKRAAIQRVTREFVRLQNIVDEEF